MAGNMIEPESSALYCDNIVYVKSIDESKSIAEIEYFDINNKIITLTVNVDELVPLCETIDAPFTQDNQDNAEIPIEELDLSRLHFDLGISEERLSEILAISDEVFSSAPDTISAMKTMCDHVDGYEKLYVGLMIGMSLENNRMTNDLDAYFSEMMEKGSIDPADIDITDPADPNDKENAQFVKEYFDFDNR
jgi:hypothetical protein